MSHNDAKDPSKLENMKEMFIKFAQATATKNTTDGYVCIYDHNSAKKVIEEYSESRDYLKALISDLDFPADRHKISAFMIGSILKNLPIKLEENSNETNDEQIEKLINLNLATSVASHILRSFYKYENKEDLTIGYPRKHECGDCYLENFHALLNLIDNEINQDPTNKVFLLSVSNMLYLLEEISRITIHKL